MKESDPPFYERDARVAQLCALVIETQSIATLKLEEAGGGDALDRALHAARAIREELAAMRAAGDRDRKRVNEFIAMSSALISLDFTPRVTISDDGSALTGLALCLNTMAEEFAERTVSKEYVGNIIQSMSDLLVVVDPSGVIRSANAAACRLSGYDTSELVGMVIQKILPDTPSRYAIRHGSMTFEESSFRHKTGDVIPASLSVSVMSSRLDEFQGLVCVARDLTERRRLEEQERWRLQQVVQRQTILLEELSTPLIPITDDILVMPVIGAIDDQRAAQILETLLSGVAARKVRLAVIDITGVRKVDEGAIRGLINAVRAVRLLGARVVLTGIRPDVAIMLTQLDIDLKEITTFSSLQSGIVHALEGRRL